MKQNAFAEMQAGPSSLQCATLLMSILPLVLRRVAETTRLHLERANESLTFRQVQLMEILGNHELSLNDLCKVHSVTPSAMSRSVDVLVRRGWVERKEDERDRRHIVLSLTADGELARQRMRQEFVGVFASIFSSLDPQQRGVMFDGLQTLEESLHI